jgi:NADH:ubiquinone oxidoreductase subunit C
VSTGLLAEAFPEAVVEEGFGPVTVDVDRADWVAAATRARDDLGCRFFDFLSAVEEPDGFRLVCHLAALVPFSHLVLRTAVPSTDPVVRSLAEVYAGAAWHERETAEMFGIGFLSASGEPLDRPGLLLPPGFEGHPLRKDFALEPRLDRPWPGDKEPRA